MIVLLIASLAFIFAILLIFFIKKTEEDEAHVTSSQSSEELFHLTFNQFYLLSCQLLEKLGLVIKENSRVSEKEIDILAENPTPFIGGPVIIHLSFHPSGAKVGTVEVMNFASNLIGERKGKAILITTGSISPEVAFLPELPAMDFIDGEKFLTLLKEHNLLETSKE